MLNVYVAKPNNTAVGKWFTLPMDADELAQKVAAIARGGDAIVVDYESALDIDGWSVYALNALCKAFEDSESFARIVAGDYDVDDVLDIAYELEDRGLIRDKHEHVGDIISDDELDAMVAEAAQSQGWLRVKHLLAGVAYEDDYYILDGYGNAENLTRDHLAFVVDELVREALRNI